MKKHITKIFLVPVLAAAVLIAACSTSWVTTAEQYVTVLTPVAGEILQILVLAGVAVPANAATGVATYSQQVTTDLKTVGTLLAAYNSADAVTTVQKIDAVCADAEQNLNSILTAAHVTDPVTQQKITAAVQLSVSSITAILALIPNNTVPPVTPAAMAAHFKLPKPSVLQQEFNRIFSK